MLSLFMVFSFLFGLTIGSFLNVVILRYNSGQAITGRSQCFSCGKILRWYELVPILSFIAQKGRCRGCASKISWQYLLVELLTGIIFALITWEFYPNVISIIYYWVVFSLLIVILVYDWKHKIIPDKLVYPFMILSSLHWLIIEGKILSNFLSLAAGLIMFLAFGSLWYFSSGRWMGLGDAKLAFGIGALLGLFNALNSVALSFIIGALAGLSLIAVSKLRKKFGLKHHFNLKSELPFAPFLVLGLILVLFFHIALFAFNV